MSVENNLVENIKSWAINGQEQTLLGEYYCITHDVFHARLNRFLQELRGNLANDNLAFLLAAVIGEVGNNSFDHNLGNWPDAPGLCFGYDLKQRLVILADRGQGVLATIKKVKPATSTPQEALRVAFTETISGRSPERRGNGLKFVRQTIQANALELNFHSGQANCFINKDSFIIKQIEETIPGVLAIIKF
jgi:hypothetical protein